MTVVDEPAGLGVAPSRTALVVPLVAAVVWAANWVLLRASGWPYSIRTLYAGWQFLPVDAVADEFATSIWNLHTQPPGWNVVVGVVANWSPFGLAVSHQLITVGLGMLLAASIASTLLALDASPGVALVLTALATMNTQVMGNASAPRYDLAVTTLLACLVWSASRLDRRRFTGWLAFVGVATTLVMTRALYHPVWIGTTLVVAWWLLRPEIAARRLAALVLIPVVLVGGWVIKNEVVVDRPTMSSWTGMNMLRAVEPAVDRDRLDQLVADGTVSGVAGVGPFRRYEAYIPVMPPCAVSPGAPAAVADRYRPIPDHMRTGLDPEQTPNFNYECYLPVYSQAGTDAWALMRAEPTAWVKARAWAVNNWFQVAPPLDIDDSALWTAERHVSRVALLGVPHPGMPDGWSKDGVWVHRGPVSLTLIVTTSALLLGALVAIKRRESAARQAVLATAAIAVMWTTFAGVMFELGEQERFRSATDPIVLALGGLLVWEAIVRRRPSRVER